MAQAKRKKRFFEVEIPLIGKTTQAQAFEISELNGRYIQYDLTRTLRGKASILQGIIKANEEEAKVTPTQLRILQFYFSRMLRKGTNYVEDSFLGQCKNSEVLIKPFLVTRKKVSRAVRKALRNKCKEEILEFIKETTSEELFEEVLKNQLQKRLSTVLKKIYPLSCCEIRTLKVKKFIDVPKEEKTPTKDSIKEETKEKTPKEKKSESEKKSPKEETSSKNASEEKKEVSSKR
jgi:ribosomal protein S3AE